MTIKNKSKKLIKTIKIEKIYPPEWEFPKRVTRRFQISFKLLIFVYPYYLILKKV